MKYKAPPRQVNMVEFIQQAREAHQKVLDFLEQYKDYVFVLRKEEGCEDDDDLMELQSDGHFLATAKEVLETDASVVDVFHKDDRWSEVIGNDEVKKELHAILVFAYGEEHADLFDYTSVQLRGQFLNIWHPSIGVEVDEEEDGRKVKVTAQYLIQYCAEPSVWRDEWVFEEQGGEWILTRYPSDYVPCEVPSSPMKGG